MKTRNKPIHINLTQDQRTVLYIVLIAGVIILECAAGFLLQHSEWRFTAEVLIVLAAYVITYIIFGKRLWVCRRGVWRDESKLSIMLSNDISATGDILLSLIYLEHYGNAEVIRIFEGMSFFNGRFFIDLINLWRNVPVLSLGLPALLGCFIAIALISKISRFF